jgi:hypothetical protein
MTFTTSTFEWALDEVTRITGTYKIDDDGDLNPTAGWLLSLFPYCLNPLKESPKPPTKGKPAFHDGG